MLDREDPFKRVVGWGNDLIENDPGAWAKYLAKFLKAKDKSRTWATLCRRCQHGEDRLLGTEVYILDLSNYFKAQETGLLSKLEKRRHRHDLRRFPSRPYPECALPSVQLLGRVLGREK